MAFFQTDNLWVNQLADGVAALVLDVKGRPVNVLGRQVLDDLEAALDRIAAEPSFRLLVLRSGKAGSFIAGADLQDFRSIQTAAEASTLSERGQRLFNKLAALRVPTVAVIAGPCLGGGLELALACDYRVVVDGPRTQLGLPEVELGLLPAWGGTQRLPRVVGMGRALELILTGRPVDAEEAHRIGLVNEVVEPGRHLERALELAERIASFPQETMLADRRGTIEGYGLPLAEGLALEAKLGNEVLEVAVRGAARFAAGEGRHGEF
jgi:3-hydroxyacyl-CoA dehydrogenase / enoyl-CoA hydratase / 3-hydroxybutyryl-CoA epimerase